MEINVRKTLKNAVTVDDEFPFYVEELGCDNEMLTYVGSADKKYTFNEMDDEFFKYVESKINDEGVYIRLIHVVENVSKDSVTLNIEAGSVFKTLRVEKQIKSEVIDYGIKIKGSHITMGTSVFDEKPHFAQINDDDFLSEIVCEMMKDLINYD